MVSCRLPSMTSFLPPHRHSTALVLVATLAFCLVATLFVLAKADALGYNALDLAIFRQTLAQTSQGDLFGLTIHAPSYLGDHASFLLLALAPFYALAPFLATLPLLQVAMVVTSLVPLLALVRLRLAGRWVFVLPTFFLLSVFSHNLVAFEFEFLVAAVPLLLGAAWGYETKRFGWTTVFLLLTALVREDLGFVLVGFGAMAWCERRPLRWRWTPALLGIATLVVGMLVTSALNGEQYKFLSYLGMKDGSWSEIPFALVARLVRPENLLVAFALLLSFLFLPLRAPLRLLPALFYWIPFSLTGVNASLLNLRVHYIAPLLPFLLWATIEGTRRVLAKPPKFASTHRASFPAFLALLLLGSALYGSFALSPFRPSAWAELGQARRSPVTAAARELLARVPKDAALAASYRTLPLAADRARLSSVHYVASGKRQLSDRAYALPDDTTWLLLDANDFLFYPLQWNDDERARGAGTRLRTVIEERGFRLVAVEDTLLLYTREEVAALPSLSEPSAMPTTTNTDDDAALTLVSVAERPGDGLFAKETLDGKEFRTLDFTLTWQLHATFDRPIELRARFVDANGGVHGDRFLPLAYGLWPTTDWVAPSARAVRYHLLLPDLPRGSYALQLTPVTLEGRLSLDAALSAAPEYTNVTTVGPTVTPARFTF